MISAATQAAATFKGGERTYLEDTSEGMSSMTLFMAIANSDRLRFPR